MNKPDELRRVLTRFVPSLRDDPARLAIFVDKGRVEARAGGTLSFEAAYTLTVVIEAYSGSVNDLFVPVLAWIAEAQPDLLENHDRKPFTYEVELLDDDTADVQLTIELTESVRVLPKDGGGWSSETLPEPNRTNNDPDVFDGAAVALWQLFLREDLIAQTSDPDFHPDG